MRNLIRVLTIGAILLLAIGCKEEELRLEGTGISEISWSKDMVADEDGEMLSLTFTAAGKWTAVSSKPEWCEILTATGVSGQSALRINITKNTTASPRRAEVSIKVDDYPLSEILIISQAEGVVEKGDGRYREINEWVYDKMSSNYLWNEPVRNIALDYSIGYQAFLKSILDGVSKQGDINHDDGAYKQDYRTEYYTQIISNAPETKAIGQQTRGNGFYLLRPVNLGTAIGVLVDTVIPGGPADRLGIKRGDRKSVV